MIITYRKPIAYAMLGATVLVYDAWIWSRGDAWKDADRRGGYRKLHTAESWIWIVEPELKRENYLRALAKKITKFGSDRYWHDFGRLLVDGRCDHCGRIEILEQHPCNGGRCPRLTSISDGPITDNGRHA